MSRLIYQNRRVCYRAKRHIRIVGGSPRRWNIAMEAVALHRMGKRDIYGRTICYAFGIHADELSPATAASEHAFLFEISLCNETGMLTLTIDAYCANSPEFIDAPDFDVDQWEAEKIRLFASPTRDGFRNLARIARAVIKGRTVKIDGGTVSLDGFVSDSAEGCV